MIGKRTHLHSAAAALVYAVISTQRMKTVVVVLSRSELSGCQFLFSSLVLLSSLMLFSTSSTITIHSGLEHSISFSWLHISLPYSLFSSGGETIMYRIEKDS